MSVEKQARRALRRMLLWRLAGELFVLPQVLLRGVIALLTGIGQWFKNLEMAVFTMELDAARRYQLITGLDMGRAGGESGRYHGLRAEVQDEEPAGFYADEDDDDE